MDTFLKNDSGKPMMSLIDPAFVVGLADVLTFGAKKYAPNNWKLAGADDDIDRIKDALLRHLYAYLGGEEFDPETNLPHIDHMQCNLMFLRHFDMKHGNDKQSVSADIQRKAATQLYKEIKEYVRSGINENGEIQPWKELELEHELADFIETDNDQLWVKEAKAITKKSLFGDKLNIEPNLESTIDSFVEKIKRNKLETTSQEAFPIHIENNGLKPL